MSGKVRHLQQRGDSFWARIVVPAKLRPILRTSELREPLGLNRRIAERDVHAAVARFHDVLGEAQRKLDGQFLARPLTIPGMARAYYAEELQFDERERNHPERKHVTDMSWTRPARVEALRAVASGRASNAEAEAVIGWAIDGFRARGNTTVLPETAEWRELARMLAAVELETLERVAERDQGNDAGQPTHPILAEAPVVELPPRVTLSALFDGYVQELKASGKGAEAERRWRPVIADLTAFLKRDDARTITKADLVRWKDARLETHAAKTVRDVQLAALRAIFQWAEDNGHLPSNPAQGIKVRVGRKTRSRERGFNDAEATALLKAAQNYTPKASPNPRTREGTTLTAAKRWTPWLCAYTGARIAEMTQLRKEDVQEKDGIPYLRITPEAGSVKSGEFRDVPVHPHLIELGFLDFVASSNDGPLFFTGAATAKTHPSKTVAGRVSEWVRSLDIVDADVAPNHGWRHRFKTVGIEADMQPRVLDAIQGHAARTAGDAYGDIGMTVRLREIQKHPRYKVD